MRSKSFKTIAFIYLYHLCLIKCDEEQCPLVQDACQENSKDVLIEKNQDCYKAAVFEYARKDLPNYEDSIKVNLHEYRMAAKLASKHGTQIIVFPEDGIDYAVAGRLLQRFDEIPDPETLDSSNNNPCIHDHHSKSSYILRELSCIARDYELYVVANFGTKQMCSPNEPIGESICPESGYLKMNTDVVFDQQGNFIKRYRKYNVYIEIFDKAPTLELVHFDTPFGRFGVFTCFDMIFRHPAIDLVETHKVDTIIFPTYWYDELPLLSAVQYQDAWSYRMNVTMLASNILKPETGTVGSGIFANDDFHYTGSETKKSSLLIASVPKFKSSGSRCMQASEKLVLETMPGETMLQQYKYGNYKLLESDKILILNENEASQTVCNGQVCCTIDYKVKSSHEISSMYVLIIRDSLRPGRFNWHEQVCTLATLKNQVKDISKVGLIRFNDKGLVSFDRLSLTGTFNSNYIYPIAAYNSSRLINRSDRKYECQKQTDEFDNAHNDDRYSCNLSYTGNPENGRIYSFGLFGRLYDEDKI